ncbi:NAD(P)/FAD-dependent oxidoreductase [Pedobacter insulae]|uniref:Dehydrogenase (Flavoprotein) n=1 Tax=Pedobacter insulae TaxID=414048 RepID=A0A1I2ZSP9_9SPHI|nr:NAD(P)/FAD-dependent oxidoreductase [Pedobacter insulae]SFH40863.1 Dehydrogenase (flavoprotein) [Pedobacter insulae]
MKEALDILIIGGGLAGLTAALHLQQVGLSVTLIEKNEFPQHKVCGEYISNEVLPYLNWLNLDITVLKPNPIHQFQLTTRSNTSIATNLPLGGFGISRFELDHFLYKQLIKRCVPVIKDRVTNIEFKDDKFFVTMHSGKEISANQIIGAYGKRSAIDIKLSRSFIQQASPFLAVKGHYRGNFPNELVAVHNFKGGYCGVSKVENDIINICYLADYNSFKKYKHIQNYEEKVLYQNKHLEAVFKESTPLFDEPLVISQLYFGEKKAVENHILMIGDTAGLIHPLCGNGMAMAMHSAKIASTLLVKLKLGEINSREELEHLYTLNWNVEFRSRIKMGRLLASLLRKEKLSSLLISGLAKSPYLLNKIIEKTHGKPIVNDGNRYNA